MSNLNLNVYRKTCLVLAVLLGCWHVGPVCAQGQDLYAGAAQIDITPQEKGYPHYRGASTGAHDPLFAKAIVLRQGSTKMAIVICDLLWIERELSSKVRLRVAKNTGIPFENMIIAGTHTHTGPAYHANIRELTGTLRPPFDKDAKLESDAYAASLIDNISRAIEEADRAAVRVYAEAGTGNVEGLSFNRRYIMSDGRARTNPGVGNPEIVRVAGPVDSELGIVFFRRMSDRQPIAALINYSLHADTFGGTAFSADYPGFLAKALQEKFGRDFVSVFAAAPCGDINHVNVREKKRPTTMEIGNTLGNAVLREVPKLTHVNASLGALSEYAYVPCQAYTPEDLEWASGEASTLVYHDTPFLERRRRLKIRSLERIRRMEAVPPTVGSEPWRIPCEVQVLKISDDLAIAGLPGEVFVELGMAIKEQSPFKTTMVIELTHSHIAYVPTNKAFTEGSYETINSRVAPGGGEMMVESAVRLLQRLALNR